MSLGTLGRVAALAVTTAAGAAAYKLTAKTAADKPLIKLGAEGIPVFPHPGSLPYRNPQNFWQSAANGLYCVANGP